jgi:hypothetical protein
MKSKYDFWRFPDFRAVALLRDQTGSRHFEQMYDHLQALVVHAGLFFMDRSPLKM